jgi:CBS domain containing-hemolysin-like protein
VATEAVAQLFTALFSVRTPDVEPVFSVAIFSVVAFLGLCVLTLYYFAAEDETERPLAWICLAVLVFYIIASLFSPIAS